MQVSWSLVAFCVTEVMTSCHTWMRATSWNWQHQYQFNWHLNPENVSKNIYFIWPGDNTPDCSSGIYWRAPSWHDMLKCSSTSKEFAFCINLKMYRPSLVNDSAEISLGTQDKPHLSKILKCCVISLCRTGQKTAAQELKNCSSLKRDCCKNRKCWSYSIWYRHPQACPKMFF